MNAVCKFFASIDDNELRLVIRDLRVFSETGVVPFGVVHQLARRLVSQTGIPMSDAMHLVQSEPLRIAAFKWLGA
jgi:hypothetical protein